MIVFERGADEPDPVTPGFEPLDARDYGAARVFFMRLSWRQQARRNPAPAAPVFRLSPQEEPTMPAKSAAQQKAAGAALSAKRGDTPKSKLQGASKSMMSMSEAELEKMASTKRKGKPEHKSKAH